MKKIYAPWRSAYTKEVHAKSKTETTQSSECPFCTQYAQPHDGENGILRRFTHTFAMLNKYPYNAGHIMILPREHKGQLYEVSAATRTELIDVAAHSQRIMTEVLGADGVNMGFNFGKAAGAGIPAHLHLHVLPRFLGDTNFMPTLCHTKQISIDLAIIYAKLKPAFETLVLE